MHIALVTVGTQGDVRPFVALGAGLQRAGYRVTIATHTDFENLVTSHDLGFRPIGGSFRQLMQSDLGRAWLESSDSLPRYVATTKRLFAPLVRPWIDDMRAAVSDADAVLFHHFAIGAFHTAEQRRVPAIAVAPCALIPTGDPSGLPNVPLPALRRWLVKLLLRNMWSYQHEEHERHRISLGLPPFRTRTPILEILAAGVPSLNIFSPHLFPRPGDWPEDAHVTGFCFLDRSDRWTPPQRVLDFLEAGPAPIYVGFGSMTGRDPEQLARIAAEAVARAKQRAIVVSGWAGAGDRALGDHVLVVDEIPHDWLFPRVAAVVHHGGAGTTAAGLRAGRPTLVTAFFGDQPFWGERVARVGAGPKPLLRRSLTADRLARAIAETVNDGRYREGAERMAAALRAEDGVGNVVRFVDRYVSRRGGDRTATHAFQESDIIRF
jgi:sterol 3beta-glucosyltransferase